MNRLILVAMASTVLSSCSAQREPMLAASAEPAPVAAPVPPAPKPTYGTFGMDVAGMDTSVLPGDNFYGFANGTWARTTPIPDDKSNFGSFQILDDLSKVRTREIIETEAANPASRIGMVYNSFMDTAAIESKGLAPIQPWLDRITALGGKGELAALYAEADRLGIPGPFGLYVGQDDKSPEEYALFFYQAGLGMPDRDYYLSGDKAMVETRAKYVDHLTKMLSLAGQPNAGARARAILAYETRIAKAHWTRTDSRDATKTYNKMTLAALEKSAPGFDFSGLIDALGADVDRVIVAQPSAFTAMAKAIATAPMQVLKDQLLVQSLDHYAAVLPTAFDQESFAFNGTVLNGTPQLEPRWKRAVSFTTGVMGDDVSKLYVAKYFPPETKRAADELVKNVLAAMDRRIDQLDWMSAETKAKAHEKMAAFTPKIGYPSQWRDMAGLSVVSTDALANAMASARFEHADQLSKLGSPIRRWEWGMTPMTINAYANFGMTEIVFPAAILQPPFFDPNADAAINYGGIGAVIGHEISHHFDDQGAKYNSRGELIDWWTPDDVKNFQGRLDLLKKQYDAYEPLPGLHVNGQLTMGENVADLAGLTVAYDAYVASLGGRPAPVIDGMTGDQRFYLGWAQVWRRNYREANLRQRLLTDPHSPSEQRVAIVRNMDPWYSAFSVKPGQQLYLDPGLRVRIW